MIKHTVFFRLRHARGSEAESQFLVLALGLAAIDEVRNLECVRQVSAKNDFDWGLTMDFADQPAYDRYNQHPAHLKFVAEHWVPEVERFLEIDYVAATGLSSVPPTRPG